MVEDYTNVEAMGKENRGGKTLRYPNHKENQKNTLAIENKLSIRISIYLSTSRYIHTDKSLSGVYTSYI